MRSNADDWPGCFSRSREKAGDDGPAAGFGDAWPDDALDACAPEGALPAWMRLEMSVAEQWAYAAEASS